jgi:hypothetical protein
MLKMRGFDKQVVAATHGRGMFTSNVFMPPSADFYVDKSGMPTGIRAFCSMVLDMMQVK